LLIVFPFQVYLLAVVMGGQLVLLARLARNDGNLFPAQ